MTGHTVAQITWRALDREGQDTCRLACADHGWLLIGHARFHDDAGYAALDYVVRCDENFMTLSTDIAGTQDETAIKLHIIQDGDIWHLNGVPHVLPGATDIDLSFTPATNLMPLRRLMRIGQDTMKTRAAWLRFPDCTLEPLDQTYGHSGPGHRFAYEATQTGFSTSLEVNTDGFVTHYPDLWQAEAQHVPL